MTEHFNPKEYEARLEGLESLRPFTIWTGKGMFQEKPQFPPHWGHPHSNIMSIFFAIYRLYETAGGSNSKLVDEYIERPYIVDKNNEVVFSFASIDDVTFLQWLSTDPEGTPGLLKRHHIEILT